MKLLTYNINGIRAVLKKDFLEWLGAVDPDVLCLQEIKAHKEQFDPSGFKALGYQLYAHSAEKKGYSGVAIACKKPPNHIEYGMGLDIYDVEGRVIRCDFDHYSVLSVYMPSGASKPERQDYKLQWLVDFKKYVAELRKSIPNLFICGDFNICHQAIDIHNPIGLDGYPGFTQIERDWMSAFLADGFVDSFRHLNKDPHQYSWWSYRAGARSKNLGWRIDYILSPNSLSTQLISARMLDQAVHSDHCAVLVEIAL